MNHPLSPAFLQFSESECAGSSELYYHLSLAIAGDHELLKLAEAARPGQPVPNLFFGAIHFLLHSFRNQPLGMFYPGLATDAVGRPDNAFPAFRDFALSHRGSIADLLSSRLVQTNEVRRCAYLFPAMVYAARSLGARPLALIEIGTSAGLNLLWDKYSYCYGERSGFGFPESPVSIRSEFRGEIPGFLSELPPRVSHRIGVDLNIVDTSIPDEAAWLRALVWPEHQERREILEAALQYRSCFTLDMRAGDGFSRISAVISEIPEESVPLVYHTHVANQVSRDVKERFLTELSVAGKSRDIIHISNNIQPTLHLTLYQNGREVNVPLARTDGHARWFEWLPSQTNGEQDRGANALPRAAHD